MICRYIGERVFPSGISNTLSIHPETIKAMSGKRRKNKGNGISVHHRLYACRGECSIIRCSSDIVQRRKKAEHIAAAGFSRDGINNGNGINTIA